MKSLVLIFLFSISAFAQLDKVSVLPNDMLLAQCRPESSTGERLNRIELVQELQEKGIFAKSLLAFPRFSAEHLRDLLVAVSYFPSWMNVTQNSDWKNIRIIYRPELRSVANAFIALGPKWLELESLHRQAVIIHELFHRISARMDRYAYSKRWVQASQSWSHAQWLGRRWNLQALSQENFVSLYAMTNPSEDFAETLTLYRINPKRLEQMNPLKYEIAKREVFLGQEFKDELSCHFNPLLTDITSKIIRYTESNYKSLKKKSKGQTLRNLLLQELNKDYAAKVFLENVESLSFLKNTKLYKRYDK